MSDEAQTPWPPRYRHLKRWSLIVPLVLLALLAVRLWWGHAAQASLDAEVAAARARGEPATLADFDDPPDPSPDDTNAADLLTRAAAGIVYTPAQRDYVYRYVPGTMPTEADLPILTGIVGGNGTPIALAHQSVAVPRAVWGVRLRSPLLTFSLSMLNQQRDLAELLEAAALFHHKIGDDAAAVGDAAALIHQSDAMATDAPTFVSHLVALGVNRLASTVIQMVAAELDVARPPVRAATIALIRQLGDEASVQTGGTRSMLGQRLLGLDLPTHPEMVFGSSFGPATAWPLVPMLVLDGCRTYQFRTRMADAVILPNWPQASRATLAYPLTGPPLFCVSHLLDRFEFVGHRFFKLHFQNSTERRVAALFLALRLYEVDHGRLPSTLDALVPRYLPAVPIDPMAPDGHALRYVATAGREAIYSVGENGIDDGGSTHANRSMASGNVIQTWDMQDPTFFYHPTPPATQPLSGS